MRFEIEVAVDFNFLSAKIPRESTKFVSLFIHWEGNVTGKYFSFRFQIDVFITLINGPIEPLLIAN